MKKQFNNKIFLEQNTISPNLKKIWQCISTANCPDSLSKYICLFSLISRVYRNYVNFIFECLKKPISSTEDSLAEIEQNLSWLVSKTNDLVEECRVKYILDRKERRMLLHIQKKNESIWFKFDERLRFIENANNELYIEPDSDFISIEIPYKIDFSEIFSIPLVLN